MQNELNFAEAVILLGGKESKIVATVDRVTGGTLLATATAGGPAVLSLLGARSELVRLTGDLVSGLAERVRGLTRFNRSERLAAAHAAIVLSAYFESFDQISIPFSLKNLDLTTSEQIALTTSRKPATPEPISALLHAEIPTPGPNQPFELTLRNLQHFYEQASGAVVQFISGLALWDELNETEQNRVQKKHIKDAARTNYSLLRGGIPSTGSPVSRIRTLGQPGRSPGHPRTARRVESRTRRTRADAVVGRRRPTTE